MSSVLVSFSIVYITDYFTVKELIFIKNTGHFLLGIGLSDSIFNMNLQIKLLWGEKKTLS